MIHVLLCLSLLLWPQPAVNVNFGCKSRNWATFLDLASNRSLWCLCISFLYTVGSFSRQQTNAHSFPMDFVWHMFWWLCGFFLDPLKQPTRQLSEGLSSMHPEDSHRTWKWCFGRWLSFSRGPVFSGSILIFGVVILILHGFDSPFLHTRINQTFSPLRVKLRFTCSLLCRLRLDKLSKDFRG